MRKHSYRILLVEDNPGDVLLVEESLRAAGIQCEMTLCETVPAALKKLSEYAADDSKPPDLLLLDYNLPGGDARQIIRAAVDNPALSRTRKAVITSSLSPRDREDALRSGAEYFIYKPADLDLFLNEVGNALLKLLSPQRSLADCDADRLGTETSPTKQSV
ncbi:MAG: response regulator [Acidobacteriaceae bacterium]|nr:response regulator [Acidobacteriaceae bacterium]MBV9442764.1 response regulator [Acidobacteriaceae bacterium]